MKETILRKVFVSLLVFGLALTTLAAEPIQGFTANGMAPLHVQEYNNSYVYEGSDNGNGDDWDTFRSYLDQTKDMGITAISVDVWWGLVQKDGETSYNWAYYDTLFSEITSRGFKIVPIMSFHKCGGNVGDKVEIDIPGWVWALGTEDQVKYKSELGNYNYDSVSLWADDLVMDKYLNFMNAFEDHFASYANKFSELNISCGPAGELRFPAYHQIIDSWSFPHRGYMQAYSTSAVADFRNDMIGKYGSVQGVANAWNISLGSEYDITPPGNPDSFFNNKDYFDTQYGRDFINWYNNELVQHGRRMIEKGIEAFDDSMSDIELGIKIPGLHWRVQETYSNPSPRAQEVTAGIISSDTSSSNGYGYDQIMEMIRDVKSASSREVVLHFTCLEMDNARNEYDHQNPEWVVEIVADSANAHNVALKGENALERYMEDDFFWEHIDAAISDHGYKGFTVLRLHSVVDKGAGYNFQSRIIDKYQASEWNSLYFRGTPNTWQDDVQFNEISNNIWQVTVTFDTPGSFKVDEKGDWKNNFGDNEPDGTLDSVGENIKVQTAGEYVITVNENNMTYTIEAGEKLDTPVNFSELSVTSAMIRLDWDDVTGAALYEVEKNGEILGSYTAAGCYDTDLEPGTTYVYKVRAKNSSKTSDWTAALSVTTGNAWLSAPTGVEAEGDDNGITLLWDSAGSYDYEVFRSTNASGGFSRVAKLDYQSVSSYAYEDTAVSANTTYYYKVRVVEENTAGIIEKGEFSPVVSGQKTGPEGLTIHFQEWGYSGGSYLIHLWNGMSGQRTLTYEGQADDGSHWWILTLDDAAASFNFTFTNSLGQWEGSQYDRTYSAEAGEIWVKHHDKTIYTTKQN